MDWIVFTLYFGACCAAASTGAAFPPGAWYEKLSKPPWTPPNWLFPIAWTALYFAMALAATRISAAPDAQLGLALWALQIVLNAIWTPVFFGLRQIGGGLIVIAALWLSVAASVVVFFPLDPLAGWLFVPYLVWVSYAAALNLSIYLRNPAPGASVSP